MELLLIIGGVISLIKEFPEVSASGYPFIPPYKTGGENTGKGR